MTNTLRVFIADDEADARDKLRRLLARNLDTLLVGEATNGLETVERVRALRPDLVLLDIRMPALDGLRAIAMLGAHLPSSPKVVFVTAYDEYAVRAFEVRAFDYLLKPFDAERLDAALERVRHQIDLEHRPEASALQSLFDRLQDAPQAESVPRESKYLERVCVQSAGRVEIVRMSDVEWSAAAHAGRTPDAARTAAQSGSAAGPVAVRPHTPKRDREPRPHSRDASHGVGRLCRSTRIGHSIADEPFAPRRGRSPDRAPRLNKAKQAAELISDDGSRGRTTASTFCRRRSTLRRIDGRDPCSSG